MSDDTSTGDNDLSALAETPAEERAEEEQAQIQAEAAEGSALEDDVVPAEGGISDEIADPEDA